MSQPPLSNVITNLSLATRSALCRFIGADDQDDEAKREEEHKTKILTHRSEVFSVFKINLNLDKIEQHMGLGKNWLELEVIDLDKLGVVAHAIFPLSILTERNTRMAPTHDIQDGRQPRKSFRLPLMAHRKTSSEVPIGEVFGEVRERKTGPFVRRSSATATTPLTLPLHDSPRSPLSLSPSSSFSSSTPSFTPRTTSSTRGESTGRGSRTGGRR